MLHATCGSGTPKLIYRSCLIFLGFWGALAFGATEPKRLATDILSWSLTSEQKLVAEVAAPAHLCTRFHKFVVMELGPEKYYAQPIVKAGGEGCAFSAKWQAAVPMIPRNGRQISANEGRLVYDVPVIASR